MARAPKPETHAQWMRRYAREAAQRSLKRAKQAVRDAQEHKRTANRRARDVCQRARAAHRAWKVDSRRKLRADIAELRAKLAASMDRRREQVAKCCGPERVKAREKGDAEVKRAREALAELRDQRRQEHIATKRMTTRTRTRREAAVARRERESESDDEVRANLSPDELIVFERVRTRIKPTERMTKTEAFQQWAHDHSQDVARILAEHAEAELRAAIKREQAERRELAELQRARSRHTPGQLAAKIRAELAHREPGEDEADEAAPDDGDDVPF